MQKHFYFLLGLLLAIFQPAQLVAQCDRVAWVAGVTPGCGAKIIDLDNGQTLQAVVGAEGLTGGQIFSYSATPAQLPSGCQATQFPLVALTCVSDQLPCKAVFARLPIENELFTYRLVAYVYDASAQNCYWDFGDGQTATGASVEHTFPAEGEYSVCLTVTDAFGCSAQECAVVTVSTEDFNWCGFDIEVTAIGKELQGKILPLANANHDWVLDSVQWYTNKSSQVISDAPSFVAQLPEYGSYTVCANYQATNPSHGTVCSATRCQTIIVAETACKNPILTDHSKLCPGAAQLYVPVCGCDGITYANECEAMGEGVSQWWAGACGTVFGPCVSELESKILSGSDEGYFTQFVNHSVGNYTFSQLDFGDGSPIWEGSAWDTIMHAYESPGIYRTNLTIWSNAGCLSSQTHLVVTDASSMVSHGLPATTDYVMPGDANRDQRANAYDLLNLGVGHNSIGTPRPDAHTAWLPQFSPNWDNLLQEKINYKHLDCDGNGFVNEYDADVILQHYSALDTSQLSFLPDAPELRLEFELDTIVVDPNNPAPIEINAWVKVGSPSRPALGLYGLAFALRYPDYVNHNPDADYDDDFFGSTNHLLWLSKDNHERTQLDIGLTRKNGLSANGYGRVAKLTFSTDVIIIIDIISREESKPVPFVVPLCGLRAIDRKGKKFDISAPMTQDTVWIKTLQKPTKTEEEFLRSKVLLSPNPAANSTELYTSDLKVESIEVLNSLGQSVRSIQGSGARNTHLDLSGWASGLYTLRIRAEEGTIEKRLIIR